MQWIAAIAGGCLAGAAFAAAPQSGEVAPPAVAKRALVAHARLPLAFEPASGAGESRYTARGAGYTLAIAPAEATLRLAGAQARDTTLRMRIVGGNPRAAITGVDRLPGFSNHFVGSDPTRWRRNVASFATVEVASVYPGIDLVWYGNGRELEYDFVVAPGTSHRRIALDFHGARSISLDRDGNLVLATANGELVQHRPIVYQWIDGLRHPIDGRYVLRGKASVGFEVARYDRTRPLVIDPALAYSTHLGGAADDFSGRMAVDTLGQVYLVGTTAGGFPLSDGARQPQVGGGRDFFVTKLDPGATQRIYSTYIGGSGRELGPSVAADTDGNVYVAGTAGAGFPTTPGAFQEASGGGDDIVAFKLNSDGSSLLYSTYIGGPQIDAGNAIAIDGKGSAYVTGYSMGGFPTTPGAYQAGYGGGGADIVVAKLDPSGSSLVYATYIGGKGADNAYGIAVDGGGEAVVVGYTREASYPTTAGAYQRVYGGGDSDVVVSRLNVSGSALVYSTLVGGDGEDAANAVALDAGGNAYFAGTTTGNFPTTAGAYRTAYGGGPEDAVVVKLNSSASALIYSTYLGGAGDDSSAAIAVDGSGRALVVGFTSGGFPTSDDALQGTYNGGPDDGFLAMLDATGSALAYATYLGTVGDDFATGLAIDGRGYVYVFGDAGAAGFPATSGVAQPEFAGGAADTFALKLAFLADRPIHQGLWWAFPAGSEAGWGINFAHQGNVLFATWFTYDASGKPTWFAATLDLVAQGAYTGDLLTTTGPAFSAVPWDSGEVTETKVGTIWVYFREPNSATLAYQIGNVAQSKTITRQVFAQPVPVCVDAGPDGLPAATNFQDLWWKFVAGTESGWGVNFTHQGDVIFLTWFTYDASGKPLWLIAVAEKQSAGVYAGPISTVTGPPFNAVPWNPAQVVETVVGSTTITFADGNRASFAYTVDGVTQTKEITRQVFAGNGTVCN